MYNKPEETISATRCAPSASVAIKVAAKYPANILEGVVNTFGSLISRRYFLKCWLKGCCKGNRTPLSLLLQDYPDRDKAPR